MQLRKTETDTLLMETYEAYEARAEEARLTLSLRLPHDPVPPLLCDADRIRQLLAILLDNACSCTPAGGRIALALLSSSSEVRLQVADNGPGIPDNEKEAVFDRFHMLDSAREDRQHFGLGLSVAKEIALLHKGTLMLTDTPGGGATFTLTLPRRTQ